MKQSTIVKYTKILLDVKASGKKLSKYCAENNLSYNNIVSTISTLKKQNNEESREIEELIKLYNEVTCHKLNSKEILDTDDKSKVAFIRDETGKISSYHYQIYRRNKPSLVGNLTREEMNTIHRLYSYYGDSLTQRVISRHFGDLSLIDFKRILRAFNITKASAPFAPHMIEECTEDELREIQLREKENSFLRKAEEDQIRNNEKLLKKYAQENIELKRKLNTLSDFKISLQNQIEPIKIVPTKESSNNINLYISDMHIGATVESGSMYKENIKYGKEEIIRRLNSVIEKLSSLGTFNTINIVMLGDNIDCCGVYGKTSRLDHNMPENMDVRTQANTFIEVMLQFISSIVGNKMCSKLNIYSVPEGNHAGNFEYVCNRALMASINAIFPDIKTVLWEEFYGVFEQNGNVIVCTHGKDRQFMKKGFPANLDDKTKVMLYEWLHEKGIHANKVHFIKGDLHTENINTCNRIDYRNVLSLFGASDYANYNFGRNQYGVSYDMFIGDNLVRGTFENL